MKYIIFDMDGVIVNSEPVIFKAALDALSSGDIVACKDDFIPFIGSGEENFIIEPCKKHGHPELIDKLMEEMFINFENNIDKMEVFPSAKPLIEELKKRGYIISLVSSAYKRKLLASLKAADIDPSCFDIILSGNDVIEKKPSPMPYLLAAEKLCAKSSDCLVIEDALSGVRSAKSAGMSCVAVTTSFDEKDLREVGADFIVDDIIKVLDYLK